MQRLGATLLALAGCSGEPTPPPQPWPGFFHPPPKPGQSITGTKQCECRACEPASCCSAEQTELSGPAPAECTKADGDYVFSEECGIRVETCTPRCYSKVWRVPKQESCEGSRPLVCCG
jgi:hypothetical protein